MNTPSHQSPVNPLPPVVIVLFLAVIAPELIFTLGAEGLIGGPSAIGWRSLAIQDYGFSARAFNWMFEHNIVRVDYVMRMITYPFVHGSFTQALFAGAMVLALGKFVGEKVPQWAVLVLFGFSSVAAAAVYGLVLPDGPLFFGAFPGVYGLIGGFTYLMWLRLGEMGAQQARAFSLIGFLLGIQLLFGLLFDSGYDWIADLAGFAAGFAISLILVPGGWSKILARMRQAGR